MQQLENNPEFSNQQDPDLTKPQIRRLTIQRIRNVFRTFLSDHGDMDMRQVRRTLSTRCSAASVITAAVARLALKSRACFRRTGRPATACTLACFCPRSLRRGRASSRFGGGRCAQRRCVPAGRHAGTHAARTPPPCQDEWVPAGMSLSIFGCFAMTELRGGSFVRGIETVRQRGGGRG